MKLSDFRLFDLRELKSEFSQTRELVRAEIRSLLDTLEQKQRARPVLATLTILCEQRRHPIWRACGCGDPTGSCGCARFRVAGEEADAGEWEETCLGGETWVQDWATADIVITAHRRLRNLRWFLSGDPDLGIASLQVGGQLVGVGKFGSWGGGVETGVHIYAKIGRPLP